MYRKDKFVFGDKVRWDVEFIRKNNHDIISRHGEGPFIVSEVIECDPESYGNVGHTQLIGLGNGMYNISGAWLRRIKE